MSLETRFEALRRDVRWLQLYALGTTAALLACALSSFRSPEDEVLRARGLVIVDAQGRDRILIGAPVPASDERIRTDLEKAKASWGKVYGGDMEPYRKVENGTNGILILDEAGHDRIALGDPAPDPPNGPRIAPATGLQINGADGFEVAGIGNFPSLKRTVLGLDAQDGTEGAMLFVLEDGTTGLFTQGAGGTAFVGQSAGAKELTGLDRKFCGLSARTPQGEPEVVEASD